MSNADYLDSNLRSLLKSTEPQLRIPEEHKADILANLLAEQPPAHAGGRMRPLRWIGWATAALIPLLVVLIVFSGGGSTVAFARVLEELQRRGYSFAHWTTNENGELQEMGRGMVLPPGLIRWDMPAGHFDGLAIVADVPNHSMYWVTKKGRKLDTFEIPQEMHGASDNFIFLGSVENLWGIVDGNEVSLGTDTKEGAEVVGYRVEQPFEIKGETGVIIYDIWADVTTGLPYEVRMSTVDPNGNQQDDISVFRDFDFETPVSEALFGLSPAPAEPAVDDEKFIITPCVGMGDLKLGDAQSRVTEVLGEPLFMIGNQAYQYMGLVVVVQDGKVYSFQCGDANGRDTEHSRQCRCRTTKGIGVGSTEQAILEAYGKPSRRIERQGGALVYSDLGAAFMLQDGEVLFMSFQIPKEKKKHQESPVESPQEKESVEPLTEAAEISRLAAQQFVVTPGVGMKALKLGDPEARITEILGEPLFMSGEHLYQYPGHMLYAKEGKVYAFHCGDMSKPDSSYVQNCVLQTQEGIGMGATEAEVIKAYGPPDDQREVKLYEGGVRWLYRSKGMVLGLHHGKIHYMLFQEPKKKSQEPATAETAASNQLLAGKWIVTPGVGMGDLKLGDPQSRITEVLGDPLFIEGEQVHQYEGFMVLAREGKVYAIYCDDTDGMNPQRVKKSRCRTTKGVGVGSTEQDILKAYGEPSKRLKDQGRPVFVYSETGTAFTLKDGKVFFMTFHLPRKEKQDKESPAESPQEKEKVESIGEEG